MATITKDSEEQQASVVNSSGLILKIGIGIVAVICILALGLLFTRHSKGAVKPPPNPVLFDLGDFTTNLSDASELKYVRTGVTLELNNKSLEKEVQDNEPLLRDCIISLLNGETSDDIMLNRTRLKKDVISLINEHLTTGEVTNIYFSDLIMQ
ncbi:MAG: flagellar basal body-associated FliL family protein [Thermacetogeniaceae bacterium]|jgi:flagellar basal body-associated protein FliL